MATPFIYQNSFGFSLSWDADIALDTTTSLLLEVQAPDQTIVQKDLTLSNISDAEAGIVTYLVQEGDFTQEGTYLLQIIDNTPGRFIPSEIKKLKVKRTLQI